MWGHKGWFVMGGGALLLLGACARTAVVTPAVPGVLAGATAQEVGAPTGRAAVEAFMAGVAAQDLRRMASVWGTARGPARLTLPAEELEKRLIVIQCLLSHDRWSFAEERARLSSGGRQDWLVEVRREPRSARTLFTTVQASDGAWFVEDLQVAPLQEFCR
jgi:hypothetical protein